MTGAAGSESVSDQSVPPGGTSTGVDPRIASMLCYAAWWVTGLLFLFLERDHRGVRFHAAQSLVLFGGLSLLMACIGAASAMSLFMAPSFFRTILSLNSLVWLGAVILWAVLMVQALRGETVRVPLIADLADRLSEPA
jgi:uncharacterized membrane protein